MSVMTNTFETYVLSVLLGTTTSAPAKVYAALFLSSPTETGTAGTEASYSGYARQEITLDTPTADGTTVSTANTNQIIFPTPSTSSGTVVYAAICDAASGGNVLVYKALASQIVLTSETSPRFNVGEIVLTLAAGDADPVFKTSILNFLRGTDLTGVTPYLAMFNGDPNAAGAELSGSGYARLALVFGSPAEQVGGQMQTSNTNSVQSAAASANWGSYAYGVVMSASTGGTRLFYKQNSASYPMNNGAQVYLTANSVNIAVN